jgi:hypothetical protein
MGYNVLTQHDEHMLQAIANITNGSYDLAADKKSLQEICLAIFYQRGFYLHSKRPFAIISSIQAS